MGSALSARIERMFSRDRAMAWLFLVLLWLTIAFVYFAVDEHVLASGVRYALLASALLLLLLNTASIVAMIRHYRNDRDHIYGLDLRHLDENRARRGKTP